MTLRSVPPPSRKPRRGATGRLVDASRRMISRRGPISLNARYLLLANLCSATGIGVVGVVFNLYLVDLHLGLAAIGLINSLNTVATAGGALTLNSLLRRWPARLVMRAGTAGLAITLLLVMLVTNLPALIVLSCLMGATIALANGLVGLVLMEEGPPAQQAYLFSSYFAIASAGGMLGGLLSSLIALLAGIAALPGGGDSVFAHRLTLGGGALLTLLAVPWLARMGPPPPDRGDVSGEVKRTIAPERPHPGRDLAVILVAVGVLAISQGLSLPFINIYFSQVLHATTSQIGLIFSVSAAIATATTFGGAALAARFGKLPTFVGTRILSAPCILLWAWHIPLVAAGAGYLLRNVFGNISGALDNNYMLEVLPAWLRARASGWRSAVYNGFLAVTTYGAGLLIAGAGYTPMFVAAAILTVLCMVIYGGYFYFIPAPPPRVIPPRTRRDRLSSGSRSPQISPGETSHTST